MKKEYIKPLTVLVGVNMHDGLLLSASQVSVGDNDNDGSNTIIEETGGNEWAD